MKYIIRQKGLEILKKILLCSGFIVTLSFATTIENAFIAYDKKDYEKALVIFESLAKERDAKVQYNLGLLCITMEKGQNKTTKKLLSGIKRLQNKDT